MEWKGSQPSEPDMPSSRTSASLIPHGKMKGVYFSNEMPDNLLDLLRRLHVCSGSKPYPTLARFLAEATEAVRDEVQLLPAHLRALVPYFQTIFSLADKASLRQGPLGGSVDGVLLCGFQIAAFIGHYEGAAEELPDFAAADGFAAGLGMGLLATASVSLASSLSSLPIIGAEIVRAAFRLGVVVHQVSQNLQPRPALSDTGPGDSWAYVVPGVTASEVQGELDTYHTERPIPQPSKVFLSARSRTSVTVSGPPASLKSLFLHSDYFRHRQAVALPVYTGLCHAKHIYDDSHVASIVQTTTMDALDARFVPRLPVFSTSTGRPFAAATARDLFCDIVAEILTQAIAWDKVAHGIAQKVRDSGVAVACELGLFRPSSLPARDVVAALHADDLAAAGLQTTTPDLAAWITTREGPSPRGKIAITGASCRLPGGADDTRAFWQLLAQGRDVHTTIPPDRFDAATHCDPSGRTPNASGTPYGCFVDAPGRFDAAFFHMSPREALQTDPMQRLALVTAYEALERAGFVRNRTPASDGHRVGTAYGQASDDYREVNTAQEIGTYFITGGCRAFGPGRINYCFQLAGPSYSVDTACSSGLAAIQVACSALGRGEVDTVVAGGMNVLTNPDAFAGLSSGHFLSRTPHACKTWDAEADGYCRADGVVSFVLKRLEDAEADHDRILGVILGAGTNHAAEAVSITHPHAGAQAYLTRQVLEQAGVDPLDVSYVEMHGTGTQAGDMQEIQSVSEVFAPATRRRSAQQVLHIGAVKANVGHGEAVAGPTALLKVLLMLEHGAIPPHIGIRSRINPAFPKDLASRNLRIPFALTPWVGTTATASKNNNNHPPKRRAVVNSFSAAGGNTSLLVEEAPPRAAMGGGGGTDPRPAHVVAVSARSRASLQGNLARLLAYLDAHPDVGLADLAYTTTARRQHHPHRVAVAATDVARLRTQLAALVEGPPSSRPPALTGPAPPVVFVFTGQGAAARPSMHLALFRDCPDFRAQLLHLDALARAQGFPSFLPAVDGGACAPAHQHPPVVAQLALVCVQMALAHYWMASLGVRPAVVVGHSLGEYAALHVAGVLSAHDVIFLVGRRAVLLTDTCTVGSHKMLAVRASVEAIASAVTAASADTAYPYEIACINSPTDTVLSGEAASIDAVAAVLQTAGHTCVGLDVAFAFHSAQTDPILDAFEAAAAGAVSFHAPSLPVVSPLLGRVVFDDKTIHAQYLRRATRATVHFRGALESARDMGILDDAMAWVEIGPHPVCLGFVRSTLRAASSAGEPAAWAPAVPSFRRDEDNWQTLAHSLARLHAAGVEIDWQAFHRPFEQQGRLRLLDLPTYAWDDKTYWLPYEGDWALTKGRRQAAETTARAPGAKTSPLRTSTVHQVLEESFTGTAGRVVVQSDLMEPAFLAAANGHRMNGCGVVTSSIHADIAFTLGQYLWDKLHPDDDDDDDVRAATNKAAVAMNMANLNVVQGLVAQKHSKTPQLIRIEAVVEDIAAAPGATACLQWYNVPQAPLSSRTVPAEGAAADPVATGQAPFATAHLVYGEAADWLRGWAPIAHLVQGRIDELERLAAAGVASRLSHRMAYALFASSLVDYADTYRGMQSVVLHGREAVADVVLPGGAEPGRTSPAVHTVAPHHIDSLAHLAGLVMNVSDGHDGHGSHSHHFAVTPGWGSMRFAEPLVAGRAYRSYVKMIPTADDPSVFVGDVYVLRPADGVIVGMVGAIKFRRYPRLLLPRFFSAPDEPPGTPSAVQQTTPAKTAQPAAPAQTPTPGPEAPVPALVPTQTNAAPPPTDNSTAAKALSLVAAEAGLDRAALEDDVNFASMGIDSLLSLVIAEKFRDQLGVTINGSLFLEYPTVGDLRAWLTEYYS